MDTVSYQLIENLSILVIAGGSLSYLLSRWFPDKKSMVKKVFSSRFPRVSRLISSEGNSENGSNIEDASSCFGCAPTGSCGSCPTNRG